MAFRSALKEATRTAAIQTVTYEEDLQDSANHQATVARLLEWLDLEKRPATTRLRRINTRPLNQLISNYDEFQKHVVSCGWSRFLDAESTGSP